MEDARRAQRKGGPRTSRTGWRAELSALAALAALVGAPAVARAELPPKRDELPAQQRPASELHEIRNEGSDRRHRMEWRYPRFRPSQYLATMLISGASLYLEWGTRGLPNNNLHGGFLLDSPTRDLLVAKTPEGRRRAADVSDVLWPATQFFGIADSLLTPLISDRGNLDVALQMTLINWQIQATSFFITRATHRTVGRHRPIMKGCDEDPGWDPVCKSPTLGVNASFLSGHVSMAFAGAASACSHHIALPMYGGNAADAIVCGALLTSATTVGLLRIAADKHWWTDVVVGALLGTATGFGIPFLFHYGERSLDGAASFFGRRLAVLPVASPDAVGLSIRSVQ